MSEERELSFRQEHAANYGEVEAVVLVWYAEGGAIVSEVVTLNEYAEMRKGTLRGREYEGVINVSPIMFDRRLVGKLGHPYRLPLEYYFTPIADYSEASVRLHPLALDLQHALQNRDRTKAKEKLILLRLQLDKLIELLYRE